MNRTLKTKRRQGGILILGSALTLAAIWFGLIRPLQNSLGENDDQIVEVKLEAKKARRLAALADRFKADLANANERLQDVEARMATGDVYRWAIRTFQNFAAAAKINIVSLDPPRDQAWGVYPTIPYQATTYSMTGTGYYHDVGKFLADLENSFPHLRLLRLELEPAHLGGASTDENEKLTFKMDLMILINPASPQP